MKKVNLLKMTLVNKTKSKYSKLRQFNFNSPLVSRILIVIISLAILSIFIKIKLIILLVAATVFNAWLANFQLRIGMPTDFELSTFATVLVTLSFGINWGIFIAIFSKLFATLSSGSLLVDHFFMMALYVNAAIITAILGFSNVFLLGMIIVLINCVIMFFISKNLLGLDVTSNLAYTLTNFVFNFIIFSILGNLVYGLL
jgi:hypothetical protein